MPVSTDIVASWRRPRAIMRKHLAMGRREDRALMFLMLGCGLIFVAQWPQLSRAAYLDPSVPLDARIGGALFAWLFWGPLLAYGLAAITRLVALPLGGRGTWYSARLALFWALLASSPAWLLYGLVSGFLGPGPAQQVTGGFLVLAFGAIWGLSLIEAEREPEASAAP
jgi:hypothetical protein